MVVMMMMMMMTKTKIWDTKLKLRSSEIGSNSNLSLGNYKQSTTGNWDSIIPCSPVFHKLQKKIKPGGLDLIGR